MERAEIERLIACSEAAVATQWDAVTKERFATAANPDAVLRLARYALSLEAERARLRTELAHAANMLSNAADLLPDDLERLRRDVLALREKAMKGEKP